MMDNDNNYVTEDDLDDVITTLGTSIVRLIHVLRDDGILGDKATDYILQQMSKEEYLEWRNKPVATRVQDLCRELCDKLSELSETTDEGDQ